jgi:hypothetical protein
MSSGHAGSARCAFLVGCVVFAGSCKTSAPAPAPTPSVAVPSVGARSDTARAVRRNATDTLPGLPPAGFGTLRQEDISLRLSSSSLQIRATPLDESIIRLLSPDSYRALSELKRSKTEAIAAVARRNGVRELSLWYVSFFAVERGETRFSPREFVITNVGRDFRPIDVIPLTPGFGEQRLRQNGRQDAVYVFDGQLDPQQPLTISYETARNDDWAGILPQIERERALVKSRASAAGRAP